MLLQWRIGTDSSIDREQNILDLVALSHLLNATYLPFSGGGEQGSIELLLEEFDDVVDIVPLDKSTFPVALLLLLLLFIDDVNCMEVAAKPSRGAATNVKVNSDEQARRIRNAIYQLDRESDKSKSRGELVFLVSFTFPTSGGAKRHQMECIMQANN
ncbi:hypothetical protein GQX74_005480 [Glossina fuscipes]|nr:hypothetical protein GQX74_005480 [Glossina fuscipes]